MPAANNERGQRHESLHELHVCEYAVTQNTGELCLTARLTHRITA